MVVPTILGVLIAMATLGLVGLGLLLVVIGRVQGQRTLPRIGLRLAGFTVVGYGLAWMASLALAPRRVLPLGDEVSFCWPDCHLHVSVGQVVRARGLAIRVRFRSDAAWVLQYPDQLRIAVRDSAGRVYLPTSGFAAEPLHPGEMLEREFEFSVPVDAVAPRLVVAYDGWLDYLIPGWANPLAQRRVMLSLAGEGG